VAGFYGKLPARGDFVSRGLPREFIERIDPWFQSGMQDSRLQLGESWFGFYQVMPIWHFYLGAGVVAPAPWLGVWIPSADRVNRSFPLLLAAPVGDDSVTSIAEFLRYHSWFCDAGDVLVQALEPDVSFEALCAAFDALAPVAADDAGAMRQLADGAPDAGHDPRLAPHGTAGNELERLLAPLGLSSKLESLVRHFDSRLARIERFIDGEPGGAVSSAPVAKAPVPVGDELAGRNLWSAGGGGVPVNRVIGPGQCVWQSEGSDDVDPQVVVTNGLPAATQFVYFLKGFEALG